MIAWLRKLGFGVLRTGTFWWVVVLFAWFGYLYLVADDPHLTWPLPNPLVWPDRLWAFWLAAVFLTLVTFGLHFFSLRNADAATRRSARRGLFYLFVGTDGRVSTSKLQLLLWTYAIAFVFVAVIFRGDAGDIPTSLEPQYFLLLGIPVVGAAGASLITSQKLEQGTVAKVPAEATAASDSGTDQAPGPLAGLGQVVSDDAGRGDIGDFQYFVFNVVGLAYFLTVLFSDPAVVLPVLPDTLVALTGASALAYLTKKGVVSDTPLLVSVTPIRVSRGESITLSGHHFTGASSVTDASPRVLVGGRPALIGSATATSITASVPADVADGTVKVLVQTPEGLETEEKEITIATPAPVVLSFHPARIAKGQSSTITVQGRGFMAGSDTGLPSVSLAGFDLSVAAASDTRIEAQVLATQIHALAPGEYDLIVRDRAGCAAASSQRVTIDA